MKFDRSRASWAVSLLTVTVLSVTLASTASAYDRWSVDDDNTNCRTCHGDFRSNTYISPSDGQLWGNIHNIHRQNMLSGDCDVCHGNDTFPVLMASSSGGTGGMAAIGCVGCHGREEDNVAANPEFPNGYGAGLRQHHQIAGVTDCLICHLDSDPANYTPGGEDIPPTYYANPGTGHPNIPTDPCNQNGDENFAGAAQGQDNDGDGHYDGDDGACMDTPVPGMTPAALMVSNFPNPFNPQTTIRYTVDVAGPARLSVYSVEGVLVKVLLEGHVAAGSHSLPWDGTDAGGRPVTSGLYLSRLETAAATVSSPMMLVR